MLQYYRNEKKGKEKKRKPKPADSISAKNHSLTHSLQGHHTVLAPPAAYASILQLAVYVSKKKKRNSQPGSLPLNKHKKRKTVRPAIPLQIQINNL